MSTAPSRTFCSSSFSLPSWDAGKISVRICPWVRSSTRLANWSAAR